MSQESSASRVDDPARHHDPGQGGVEEDEESDEVIFSCRLDNAESITTILSCLSHGTRKDQQAQCEVTKESMTLVVSGRAKYTQAQGSLDSSLFQEYDCVEGAKFGINLTTLLECLQIFGRGSLAQTSVSMAYQEARATFRLTLEGGGVFTSCEIRTIHQDEEAMKFSTLAKAFGRSKEVCRCILKGEAFQELADLNGATSVSVTFGQEATHLQLYAKGSNGSSEIDFPKSSQSLVCFECTARGVSWAFLMTGMETGMRALGHANETYFRVNEEGILCIQHQVI
ncbi:unnamed protein product [Ectocarpus sp. CCAP 1310/34]|nr:unnamed protein product [Ectocarpus sp. CCAP 1310/34]